MCSDNEHRERSNREKEKMERRDVDKMQKRGKKTNISQKEV